MTGPLRSRRARQKKAAAQPVSMPVAGLPNEIKADDTVLRTPPAAVSCQVPWSVWPLAGTTIGLMAVSLTHLSDGVTQLTAIPSWQSWAMAIGIDCRLLRASGNQRGDVYLGAAYPAVALPYRTIPSGPVTRRPLPSPQGTPLGAKQRSNRNQAYLQNVVRSGQVVIPTLWRNAALAQLTTSSAMAAGPAAELKAYLIGCCTQRGGKPRPRTAGV
jgi:hypothetical protein